MGKLSYRQLEQYCGRDCGARQTEKKKKKAAPGPGGKLSYEALEEYCGRQPEPRAPSSSFVTPQPGTSLPRLGANSAARGSAAGAGRSAPSSPSAFVPVQPGTSLPRLGAGAAAQNGGTKVKTATPSPFASARQSGSLPKLGGEWTNQNSGPRTAASASPPSLLPGANPAQPAMDWASWNERLKSAPASPSPSPFLPVQPGTTLPQLGAGQFAPAAKSGKGHAAYDAAPVAARLAQTGAVRQAVEDAAPVYTWQDLAVAAEDTTGSEYGALRQQAKVHGAEYEAVRDFEAQHSDADLLRLYADPSVRLNEVQLQTAQRLVRAFDDKYPLDGAKGYEEALGEQLAAQMQDPDYAAIQRLRNKVSALGAAASGAGEGFGFTDLLMNLGGWAADLSGDEDWQAKVRAGKEERAAQQAAAQLQHPLAYGLGMSGGKMAEYALGKQLMGGVPVLGDALHRVGEAANRGLAGLGGLGGAAAGFFTPDRVAGLLGDQLLDTVFDTLPELQDNLDLMRRQQAAGLPQGDRLTGGDVALAAAGNFLMNALYNLGSEAVPAALRAIGEKLFANAPLTEMEQQALKEFYAGQDEAVDGAAGTGYDGGAPEDLELPGPGHVDLYSITDLDDFVKAPEILREIDPEELYEYLQKQGYSVLPLSRSSTINGISYLEGGGFKVNWGGDRILQYHPDLGSHHGGAYYKVSSGVTGIIRIDL